MKNKTNNEEENVQETYKVEAQIINSNDSGQKLTTPMAIIVAGFLIMVGMFANNMPIVDKIKDKVVDTEKVEEVDTNVVATLNPVSASEHILGDLSKAEVTIVEFSDLECPYCKTFHTALHSEFAKYPGKIAWVYRHFPLDSLHPKARNEALASECAATIGGNDAFWKYIDIIFANTPSNNGLDSALLPVFAEKIGLNKALFTKCLIKDTNGGESLETTQEEKVSADYQDGVRAGVTGTPHSILILKDGTQIPIKGADIVGLNKTLEVILK